MNTTIIDKTILLSKKGMKELKKKIAQLGHDRNRTLQSLRKLDKSLGREERLERIERVSTLEIIESELADKKMILSYAKLLPSERTRLQVAIGSVVELIDKHGRMFRFTIVDSVEANPSDGRISTLSPLGQNLIGKTVKETVRWGRGDNWFKLVKIG
jgi:transcription elongation factor GreA